MTIRLDDNRRPKGHYTWVAVFRDGSVLHEFFTDESGIDHPQVSFDVVAGRDDVAQVHLVPVGENRSYIRIDVRPGERVIKKWTRTFTMNLDGGPDVEQPTIDSFQLVSDRPVWHYAALDGSILITTSPEP